MRNTDRFSGYDGPTGNSVKFTEIHFVIKGKEWARGYDAETIAKRSRDFKHFDFRDLLERNPTKERRLAR